MNIRKQIGINIKSARKHMRLTQPEFCEEFNEFEPTSIKMDQPALSGYENGLINIPGDKLEKLRIFTRIGGYEWK